MSGAVPGRVLTPPATPCCEVCGTDTWYQGGACAVCEEVLELVVDAHSADQLAAMTDAQWAAVVAAERANYLAEIKAMEGGW